MHKKIAVLLCIMLVVLSFTGCTSSGRNYLEEREALNKWEAYQLKLNGKFEVAFPEETYDEEYDEVDEITEMTMSAEVDIEGYINEAAREGHLTIKLLSEEIDELPTIDLFFNKEMIYVNKAYLLYGDSLNRFDQIEAEYIGWPVTTELGVVTDSVASKEWDEKTTQILKDIEVDVPFEVSGRTYTLKLNHEQAADIAMAYGQGLYAQLDTLLKGYFGVLESDFGLSVTDDEDMEALAALYENSMDNIYSTKEKVAVYTGIMKDLFDGSYLEMERSFTDQAVDSCYKGRIQYLENTKFDVDLKLRQEKVQKRNVTIPKDVKVLTAEEYAQYRYPSSASFYLYNEYDNVSMNEMKQMIKALDEYDYVACFKTNDEWYLDADILTTYLEYTLRYDEARKRYYLVSDDEMTYDKVYEQLLGLVNKYELEDMSEEDYEKKVDEIYAGCKEIDGAKRLYLETTEIEDTVYVTLTQLHQLGFESIEEIEAGEYKDYFAAYLDVLAPIKQ